MLALAGTSACGESGISACEPPLETIVRRPLGGDPASVIIHYAREVDLPALARSGRAGRRSLIEALHRDARRAQARTLALLRRHGVEPRARLWTINAVAATLPTTLIDEIARLPEVERIEPDLSISAPITNIGNAATPAWNLSAIRAPDLWATGQRGAGVVVAVLDSGVDVDHPDLAASWRSTAGWYDPYDQHASPFDGSGHGTRVTGLLVGGATSGEPIGVAPDARWIAARIYDDAGIASLSGIHLALQWVLDPDGDPTTEDAADIVTASWGYSDRVNECYLEFEPDLAALRAAQVATVFAAGNTGPYPASSISPANNPSAFAAGAVDEDLAVITSSGRGPSAGKIE
jgi:serine protease AprX